MKKRILSLALALLLCLGTVTATAGPTAGATQDDPLPVLWLSNDVTDVLGVMDGCILVWGNAGFGGIDFSGRTMIAFGNYHYHGTSGMSSVIDESSNQENRVMSEGLVCLSKDGKYGFINTKGDVAIPFEYDDAWAFSEGLAPVKVGELWGYIDHNNNMVIAPQYSNAGMFNEGVAAVIIHTPNAEEPDRYHEEDYETVYIKQDGTELFRKKGDCHYPCSDGLISSKYDWDDLSGYDAFQISPYWDLSGYDAFQISLPGASWGTVRDCWVGSFSEGLAIINIIDRVVWDGNKTYTYQSICIDTEGNKVFSLYDSSCGGFSDGLAMVRVDNNGDGMTSPNDMRRGYVDRSGKFVIEPQPFSKAGNFKHGLAVVEDHSWGQNVEYGFDGNVVIDRDGNYVLSGYECRLLDDGRYGVCRRAAGSDGDEYQYGIFENPYHPDYSAENALKARDLQQEADTARMVRNVAMAGAAVAVVVVVVLFLLKKTAPKRKARKAARKERQAAEKEQQAAKAAALQARRRTEAVLSGTVTCSCGTVNPATAKFCQSCGKPVVVPGRCVCGHQNEPGAKFCQACGKPLGGGEEGESHEA